MSFLKPGDIGIDYSFSTLGEPDDNKRAAQIVKDGGKFVIRYSSGVASHPANPSHKNVAGKLITPGEFHALVNAGLDVIANDEWYESRVTEGAPAGIADGKAALTLWRSCGYRKGAVIIPSWDQAPDSKKYGAVAAYLKGYTQALNGYYTLGLYAGTPALRYMMGYKFAHYGWRPNAYSWSNDGIPYQPNTRSLAARNAVVSAALTRTPAHLLQTGNYWYGKNADEVLILRADIPTHRNVPNVPTPPKPTPKPAYPYSPHATHDNVLVSKSGEFSVWLLDDGRLEIRKNHIHVRFI